MREGKLPLRAVLQNFIEHVDCIEARRYDGEDLYEKEFQELKAITESLKSQSGFECSEGEKEVNRRKNRYKDILPYDYTRVVLSPTPAGSPSTSSPASHQDGSDYINANYIRGAGGSRAYIASQGPLPHTLDDFWRMVVQCDVQVIVMASNETEGGKHKCECYWVCSEGEERLFGAVRVAFVKCRQVCPDFLVRTLKITFTNDKGEQESRMVCQFHYSQWPDHGVPGSVRPLLSMVRLVRECQASETLPLLVHCSAGCGRTGTICAIDHVWTLMRTGRLPDHVDLLPIVKEMRRQRVAMVQTRDQYVLLYRAVRKLFQDRLALIDDHPYANVAVDGSPLGCGGVEGGTEAGEEPMYEQVYCDRRSNDSSLDSPVNSLRLPKQQQQRHGSPRSPSPILVLRPPSPMLLSHPSAVHPVPLSPNVSGQPGGGPGISDFRRARPPLLFSASCSSASTAPAAQQNDISSFSTSLANGNLNSSSNTINARQLSLSNQHLNNPTKSSASTPTSPPVAGSSTYRSPSNPSTPNSAPFYLSLSSDLVPKLNQNAHENSVSSPIQSAPFNLRSDSNAGVDETDHPFSCHHQRQQPQVLVAKYSSPAGTPYGTPVGTPGHTPAVTPNFPGNPIFQSFAGGSMLLSPPNPPTPPTRSQTPSPVIALNKKAYDGYTAAQNQRLQQQLQQQQQQQKQQQQQVTMQQQETQQSLNHVSLSHPPQQQQQQQHKGSTNSFPGDVVPRKSSGLSRRPSIQKLREMFESKKEGFLSGFGDSDDRFSSVENTSPESDVPPLTTTKLSRSASSVTLRNSTLSLHNEVVSSTGHRSGRLMRKACLGSEESLNILHATPVTFEQQSFNTQGGQLFSICPPPPPINDCDYSKGLESIDKKSVDSGHYKSSNSLDKRLPDSYSNISGNRRDDSLGLNSSPIGNGADNTSGNSNKCGRPPSSPVYTSPNSKKRHPFTSDSRATQLSAKTTLMDEKPALPIKIKKKSKSFRYTREQPNATMPSSSPEIVRKQLPDSNSYFSLDRLKNELQNGTANLTSNSSLLVNNSRNIGSSAFVRNSGNAYNNRFSGAEATLTTAGGYNNDPSSPRDGFKLTVFDQSKLTTADGRTQNGRQKQQENEEQDTKPLIPPKKSVQERFKATQSQLLSSSTDNSSAFHPYHHQQQQLTIGGGSEQPSTVPERRFSEAVLGKRRHLVSSYDNSPVVCSPLWKSPQNSDSDQSLYDQLPGATSADKHPSVPSRRAEQQSSLSNILSNHKVYDLDCNKKAADYVNARLVGTSKSADSETRIYAPLPARRTSTDVRPGDKSTHDYANFFVNNNDQLSMSKEDESKSSTTGHCKQISDSENHGDNSRGVAEKSCEVNNVRDDCQGSSARSSKPKGSTVAGDYAANTSFLQSVQELRKVTGIASLNSAQADAGAMAEPIDFGENSEGLSEDEAIEFEDKVVPNSTDRSNCSSNNRKGYSINDATNEVLLHSSLDSIARQVYQDCEEYLLYGNNKSPVPSLMPKQDSSSLKSSRSSTASRTSEYLSPSSPQRRRISPHSPQHRCFALDDSSANHSCSAAEGTAASTADDVTSSADPSVMDVSEVRSKVSVTPQGLRTRERRNSYRQAVNPVSANNNNLHFMSDKIIQHRNNADGNAVPCPASVVEQVASKIGPDLVESAVEEDCSLGSGSMSSTTSSLSAPVDTNRKSIHKYETIWFEKTRETSRSDENLRLGGPSVAEDDLSLRRTQLKSPLSNSVGNGSNKCSGGGSDARTGGGGKEVHGVRDAVMVKSSVYDFDGFVNSLERSRGATKDSCDDASGKNTADSVCNNVSSNCNNSNSNSSSSSGNSSSKNNNVGNFVSAIQSSTCSSAKNIFYDKEPIYVNTSELRASSSQQQQQQQQHEQHQPSSLPLSRQLKRNSNESFSPSLPSFSLTRQLNENLSKNSPGSPKLPGSPFVSPSSSSPTATTAATRDSDSFPMISKPPGPCPTTPTKHHVRVPAGTYTQPKGLGGIVPMDSSEKLQSFPNYGLKSAAKSPWSSNQSHSLPHQSRANEATTEGKGAGSCDTSVTNDFMSKSRSLPPPPLSSSSLPFQQNNRSIISSSGNRSKQLHHNHSQQQQLRLQKQQQQQQSLKSTTPHNLTEPIYTLPFDQKTGGISEHLYELPSSTSRPPCHNLSPSSRATGGGNTDSKNQGGNNVPAAFFQQEQQQRGNVPRDGHISRSLQQRHQQQRGNVPRDGHISRPLQQQEQQNKARIVGDVAIVGDSAVKLRRVNRSAALPPDEGAEGPVAPPRVKRHSSVGGRDSSSEDGGHAPYSSSTGAPYGRADATSPLLHRRSTTCTTFPDWGEKQQQPPALPAKTGIHHLHHLLPPPLPPPPSSLSSSSSSSALITPSSATTITTTSLPPSTPLQCDDAVKRYSLHCSSCNAISNSSNSAVNDPHHHNHQEHYHNHSSSSASSDSFPQSPSSSLSQNNDGQLPAPPSKNHHPNHSSSPYSHPINKHQDANNKTNNNRNISTSNTPNNQHYQPYRQPPAPKPYPPPSTSSPPKHATTISSSTTSINKRASADLSSSHHHHSRGSITTANFSSVHPHHHQYHHHHSNSAACSSDNWSGHPFSPPHLLQRSLTSSAILVNTTTTTPTTGNNSIRSGGRSGDGNRSCNDSDESNNKSDSSCVTGDHQNRERNTCSDNNIGGELPTSEAGVITETTAITSNNSKGNSGNIISNGASQSGGGGGKFSMPGLFKKFRNASTTAKHTANNAISNTSKNYTNNAVSNTSKNYTNNISKNTNNNNDGGVSTDIADSHQQLPSTRSYLSPYRDAGKKKKRQPPEGNSADVITQHQQQEEEQQSKKKEPGKGTERHFRRLKDKHGTNKTTNGNNSSTTSSSSSNNNSSSSSQHHGNTIQSLHKSAARKNNCLDDAIFSNFENQNCIDLKGIVASDSANNNSNNSTGDSANNNTNNSTGSRALKRSKTSANSCNDSPSTIQNNKSLVSPTSPKPLVRALGKLKFLRGNGSSSNNNSSSSGGGSKEAQTGSNNHQFNPLQKSASVGHNMFTAVVQDCGLPRTPKCRAPSNSPPPARQHYL